MEWLNDEILVSNQMYWYQCLQDSSSLVSDEISHWQKRMIGMTSALWNQNESHAALLRWDPPVLREPASSRMFTERIIGMITLLTWEQPRGSQPYHHHSLCDAVREKVTTVIRGALHHLCSEQCVGLWLETGCVRLDWTLGWMGWNDMLFMSGFYCWWKPPPYRYPQRAVSGPAA